MKSSMDFTSQGDITLERRARILELLNDTGQVKVNNLSNIFNVSEVTVRNDLDQLEKKGLLIRTRGGGIKTNRVRIDYQFDEESKLYFNEKKLIGKKAAELVNEDDTIIIDSGSTSLELAHNLSDLNNLTVITNGLNIAGQFINKPNVKVIMLGGILRQSTLSLIGPIAEDSIKNLYCDKVFLGINGIDSKHGISTTHIEDAHLNKLMIDISKEVIVLTDSSKFLKRSFATIAPLSIIDTLVTDSNVPEEELKNLQKEGIKTIVV